MDFILKYSFVAVVIFGSFPAHAEPTFGAEFNFSNIDIVNDPDRQYVNSPEAIKAQQRMKAAIERRCPQCQFEVVTNQYGVENVKVTYPDGFYFVVATDPSVVEVQTKPSTAAVIEQKRQLIQDHIFATAKEAGLEPAAKIHGDNWAGSHIHVGLLSTLGFEQKRGVKMLRNFLVDFTNHSELAEGVFTRDLLNAPALRSYPASVQRKYANLIADVDSGKIKTVEEFAKRLRAEVYSFHPYGERYTPTSKYQAFNVNRIDGDNFVRSQQTMEIRAMRGQANADDFVKLTRLLTKRIEFVADQPEIKIQGNGLFDLPLTSDAAKAASFFKYVREAGLDFADYEKFLNGAQRKLLVAMKPRLEQEVAIVRAKSLSMRCMNVFSR